MLILSYYINNKKEYGEIRMRPCAASCFSAVLQKNENKAVLLSYDSPPSINRPV